MNSIPTLLLTATLLPFFAFWIILILGPKLGRSGAYVSVGAILGAAILSYISLGIWLFSPEGHWPQPAAHHAEHHDDHGGHSGSHDAHGSVAAKPLIRNVSLTSAGHASDEHAATPPSYTGVFYTLGTFGENLRIDFSYYIDTLTIAMYCMVTLIASCIHFYATGYMSDELTDVHDHEVHLRDGRDLVRPGRFYRFFQYLSLFSFSMLGLVLAGNIFLVFVFWELVGICSYFLIGFYVERKSASTAANKAFIVNRVGDFGMIIGLMAIWSSLGTFAFGDIEGRPGLFSLVRTEANHHRLEIPDAMLAADASREIGEAVARDPENWESEGALEATVDTKIAELREAAKHGGPNYGYWLLVVGGVGIFCGCVGKSAQFPLHVWLPDAMEGPTPVSALVHSATMVAAGVYLVGRFYPMFLPEVLLVIAIIGCITLFLAATIAITAVDIKRVLAYSTISQLGYMMLALGVGGWVAGLMHLITHAFFKSLLFLCSGSVIHAVHTNDMRLMGGLLRKMPVTAITMLIGCLAIAGVGVPFVVGFSGYYSKDQILEQAYSLYLTNGSAASGVFFAMAAGGAAITAFYMFRMWYMTFVGQPRDVDRFDHAHESPPVMFVPLLILSVFAIAVAWDVQMIGYAIVPAAMLLFKGSQEGWFQPSTHGHGHHGHDDHAHGHHGHDVHGDHGHAAHDDHAAHAPLVTSHGHAPADHHLEHDPPSHAHVGHDDHPSHHSAHTGVTWAWVFTLLIATLVGGRIVETILRNSSLNDAKLFGLSLQNMLEQARPAGTDADMAGAWINWTWPSEHKAHAPEIVVPVTLLATGTWVFGIGLATLMYGVGYLSPEEVRRQFQPIYRLLWNKWYFDELYNALFVQPAHVVARFVAGIDRNWIDGALDGLARGVVWFSRGWDYWADRTLIDGLVNVMAGWTYSFGLQLRSLQTGRLRQYVMFIVLGSLAVFVLVSFFWNSAAAH
jgi:NADH-quinone oxidoreductase subunit L